MRTTIGRYFDGRIVLVVMQQNRSEINVFPHPQESSINFRFTEIEKSEYPLSLSNAHSQQVFKLLIGFEAGTSNNNMPVNPNLPAGNYYLKQRVSGQSTAKLS